MSKATHQPAKRGDFVAVQRARSMTDATWTTTRLWIWTVGRVTAIYRNGKAKEMRQLTGTSHIDINEHVRVAPATMLDADCAWRAIEERGSDEFEDLEAVRAFVEPFLTRIPA